MQTIRQIILASTILVAIAYTGGPGLDGERCLWPTDPSVPECVLKQTRSQPT